MKIVEDLFCKLLWILMVLEVHASGYKKDSQGYLVMPDILWDPRNPMFDEQFCGLASRKFSVKFDDLLKVRCANLYTNNGLTNTQLQRGDHSYNVLVTSSYDTYLSRTVTNETKLLYECREQYVRSNNREQVIADAVRLKFNMFQGYDVGKTYYFFTTSDGTEESLKNKKGVDASKHMRFQVYVCDKDSECLQRNRVNPCVGQNTNTSPQTGNSSDMPGFGMLIIGSLLGLLLGIVIGAFLRSKCQRKQTNPLEEPTLLMQTSNSDSNESTQSCTKEAKEEIAINIIDKNGESKGMLSA